MYHVYAYGRKTVRAFCFFFEYCSLSWGWGGVGGHVNVPCTSYMIYCHVAKISGIFYYVTCCYAAEISSVGWGWGGVGGHVNVPRTSYRISSVGWGWGGVGVGGQDIFPC